MRRTSKKGCCSGSIAGQVPCGKDKGHPAKEVGGIAGVTNTFVRPRSLQDAKGTMVPEANALLAPHSFAQLADDAFSEDLCECGRSLGFVAHLAVC